MSTPMTKKELDGLKLLAAHATPGPWERDAASIVESERGRKLVECVFWDADLFFLIESRNSLPRLLDEVENLRYTVACLEARHRSLMAELRNSQECLDREKLAELAAGRSLADVGFCQGTVYTGKEDS